MPINYLGTAVCPVSVDGPNRAGPFHPMLPIYNLPNASPGGIIVEAETRGRTEVLQSAILRSEFCELSTDVLYPHLGNVSYLKPMYV